LQDWAVDVGLVPYHVAGCLGITYYIMRKPPARTFHAFYKRYRDLVGEMVLLVENDGADPREFANVIAHHAGTTSAYVSFFLSTHRATKFGVDVAANFNGIWMHKLFHAMSSKIAEVRARVGSLRIALTLQMLGEKERRDVFAAEADDGYADPACV
jgi:hypothetical protein